MGWASEKTDASLSGRAAKSLVASVCLEQVGQGAKSSKPIGKTKIEEHNCIRGRGLLQKLPRNETGEVQRCEEMLAYGPTNLKVGLTPDEARARRSYWHVLKAVEGVFCALAPEPYPLESSGYVP